MKKNYFLVAAICLMAFWAQANHLTPRLTLSARLQGQNEVPVVTTNANGVASFMLNASRDTLQINVAITGMKPTAIHIHEGKAGANGGVVKDLTPNLEGNIVRTVLTGNDLTAAILKKVLSGALYVNVHSAAFPSGEIRGQITIEEDRGFASPMSGDEQVPAVSTKAVGYGVYSLDKSGQRIQFKIVTENLSGAIEGVHFHAGKSGANGGVVADLTAFIKNGNTVEGIVDVPATFAADAALGGIYINLHTKANPSGEIRGQLVLNSGIQFDAMIDVAQAVTPLGVPSKAEGVAHFSLNYTLDTMSYYITAKGLTSAINFIHLHEGVVGQEGSIGFNISPIVGNTATGRIEGKARLTTNVLNRFLTGGYYVNFHTKSNPDGETRGQVFRLAREGYISEVSGTQLSPASSSKAKGGGLVTVDRNQSNAHYMIAVDGLSGAVTAAHFHKAVKGANGGVIYELPSATGVYGYWSKSSNPAFSTAFSNAFRGDSVYVVFHTAANPNGEVRGQLIRNYRISQQTTAADEVHNESVQSSKLFPNPVNNTLNLELNSLESLAANIVITDASGRVILTQSADFQIGINQTSIAVETLQSGFYFLQIQGNGRTLLVRKFVKA